MSFCGCSQDKSVAAESETSDTPKAVRHSRICKVALWHMQSGTFAAQSGTLAHEKRHFSHTGCHLVHPQCCFSPQ